MNSRVRRLLFGIVVAKLVLGIAAAFLIAPWQGHEPDFYNVIRFIIREERLPTLEDYENPHLSQATHPPLYPLIALPLVAIIDSGELPVPPSVHPSVICDGGLAVAYNYALTTAYNPPLQDSALGMVALRLLNLVLMTGAVFVVFLTGLLLFPEKPVVALAAAGFLAFEPKMFFLGVTISNESLLLLLCAINLYTAVRLLVADRHDLPTLIGLGASAVLAGLTKLNGLGLLAIVGFIVVVFLFGKYGHRISWRTRVLVIGGVLLVVALIGGVNYLETGNILGRYQNLDVMVRDSLSRIDINKVLAGFRDTGLDLQSGLPTQRENSQNIYLAALAGLLTFGVAAMVYMLYRGPSRQRWSATLLLLYIGLSVGMVIARATVMTPLDNPSWAYAPFRYYIMGIPALFLVLSAGLALWKRPIFHILGLAWILGWGGLVLWAVQQDFQRNYSTLQTNGLADVSLEVISTENQGAVYPHILELAADASEEFGAIVLNMENAIGPSTTIDFVGRATLIGQDGIQSQCEFIPRGGYYGTTRWEPNAIVSDSLIVPNCASENLTGPITLVMDWLDGDTVVESTSLALNSTELPRAASCTDSMGVFEGSFQVVRYNSPEIASRSESFLPSVNWYVRETPTRTDLARTYRLVAEDGQTEYRCTGQPRLGVFPFSRWKRGIAVYFDECAVHFPEDAPLGNYEVYVGLEEPEGDLLLLTSASEEQEDPHWLHVGRLDLEP